MNRRMAVAAALLISWAPLYGQTQSGSAATETDHPSNGVVELTVRPVQDDMHSSDLGTLLDQLARGPFERANVFSLEGQRDDGRVIPALQSAFARAKSKYERQWIASTLIRLGDQTPEYSAFLIDSDREAIEDRSPPFAEYDRDGRMMKGQFSAEFEIWCRANGKNPRSVAALQFGTYPEDMLVLARARDPRAMEALRKGLQSPNPLVVAYAVQGLGRLQDVSAIPLIAKVAEGLPASARSAIAMNLPWYSNIEAARLMERLAPDAKAREFMVRMVQGEQLQDQKDALRRQGKEPKQ